jgi:uncharacterized protein (DUF952 family)
MSESVIYHYCPRADWEAARSAGVYEAGSLATEGFIHFSPRDQVHESASVLTRGRTDLVVLEVDQALLPKPAVWEQGDPPHPDGRLFPHVYGPVPVEAVVAVHDLPPQADGSFAPLGR